MRLPEWEWLARLARGGKRAPDSPIPISGQFQIYSHSLPDRYPWLFQFAADQLRSSQNLRLLSFGCSRGDEVFALRNYFPAAHIRGIDVDARNIDLCEQRMRRENAGNVSFAVAASTEREATESYDAIFCLAVLCLGDLTTSGAPRCDPSLRFDDYERIVTDFARCIKPSGLLLLHTTNFRFCDTRIARGFDTLLEAQPEQMAPDVQFGRDNCLLPEPRYRAVAFRKRASSA